jgi:superfamily II DNA or RNA helicase
LIQLRDYQQAAVDRIRFSYASGRRAPLYQLSTGGGKTVIFAHIAAASLARGKRVWVLVHRAEILTQTSRALAGLGVPHGRIASGSRHSRDSVQIASVQTLARRLAKIESQPDLIIIDESQHAVAGQWRKILDSFPQAKLLGVTATPARMDGQGLGVSAGGFFDDLILGPSTAELTAAGYLCPAEVYAPSAPDLAGVRRVQSDFDRSELAGRMDKSSITGDAVTHYRKLADGLPAIAFCVSVAHARHVAEQFLAAGYRAACLDGGTDDATRKRLIDGLGDGSLQVLTSCEIVSEGTDVPIVAAAILLRPTQSEGLYLQQVGRVLRPYPGKRVALILDHAGNCLRHGMPDDDRIWTLEGRKRKAKKNEDPEALSVRQCPQCFRVYQAFLRACPGCGLEAVARERKLEERPGELVKIEKAKIEQERRREVARCKSFEDLQILARAKGYRPGWARHVWDARERKAQKW